MKDSDVNYRLESQPPRLANEDLSQSSGKSVSLLSKALAGIVIVVVIGALLLVIAYEADRREMLKQQANSRNEEMLKHEASNYLREIRQKQQERSDNSSLPPFPSDANSPATIENLAEKYEKRAQRRERALELPIASESLPPQTNEREVSTPQGSAVDAVAGKFNSR